MGRLAATCLVVVAACASHHHDPGGDAGTYSAIRVAPDAALSRLDYVRIVDIGLSALLPTGVVPAP